MGWLNQCKTPTGQQVDNYLSGFSQGFAGGYYGVGGGMGWSPTTGETATILGVGVGYSVTPGEQSIRDYEWGGGW